MKSSVAVIALGNIAAKGAALLREVLFAGWFGTGEVSAAYRITQTAFVLPTHAFAGDSLSSTILPLYRGLRKGDDPEAPRVLVLVAAIYAIVFSLLLGGALYLFAGDIAAFIASGATARTLDLAAMLLKIMALSVPFYILASMLTFIETAYGEYGGVAWRPMLFNIGSILGAGLAVWTGHDHWLATGLLVGHVLFFGWTLLQLRRLDRILPARRPSLAMLRQITWRFVSKLTPLLGLPLLGQANILLERNISSWLGNAVIPAVDYARIISDTSVQLIAVPLGILTMATRGGDSAETMRAHVGQVLGAMLLFAVPVGAFVFANAEGLVRLLFARGAFDDQSVAITTPILAWMGAAIGFSVTAYYLVKVLNAQLRNREALIFTAIAVLVNAAINLMLWRHFGSMTIGIGTACYAATLFGLCLWALGQGRVMAGLGLVMLPVLLAQLALSWAVIRLAGSWQLGLGLNVLGTAALWLLAAALVPRIRRDAAPVLGRLPIVRRLY